jgi:GrpB-like predicted nucleotidyltransferase (UPF0157 family)
VGSNPTQHTSKHVYFTFLSDCLKELKMASNKESKQSADNELEAGEYFRAVTIGEIKPLNSTIYLSPYDSCWPSQFLWLSTQIRDALSEKVLLLEHVGSTSVPGLCAKPIIDMVLAVSDSANESSYIPPLEKKGFVLRIREPNWFEHRMLKTPRFNGNLHVFSAGCEEINRMIAFRNWLRFHEEDRRLYEEAKCKLAARIWEHVQDYADAKSEVVKEILARALISH